MPSWNRVLVVAGPIAEVELFEAIAASDRPIAIDASRNDQSLAPHWREKRMFSLRRLLLLVEPTLKRRFREKMPRDSSAFLASRLETLDGRLRLEYWFHARGKTASIERLCRAILATKPSLNFVLVGISPPASDARACLMTATGDDRYQLPAQRLKAHWRSATRHWAKYGSAVRLVSAAQSMLEEVAAHWDQKLAGLPCGAERPGPIYKPEAGYEVDYYQTLVAVGPAPEIEWLIARARGRLCPPARRGRTWHTRPDISFRALSELLPTSVRPETIPSEIDRAYSAGVWQNRGMIRVRWSLDPYKGWGDDDVLEQLLIALSRRYRELCFIMTEEKDYDAFGRFIGAVAEVVGIEGGVVSGVFNLESSGVRASDWRPRHDKRYHAA